MVPVQIAGLGWYLPERRVTNKDLEATLGIPADWIGRVTGVQERRYYDNTRDTSASMAAAAGRMALHHAGLVPTDLDAIIGASAAPQQALPCTAAFIQRELGAPDGKTACFDINATCLSFLFALQMAAHLVAAGAYKTILICSSEIVTPTLNPAERESAALFGDAAAAAVITRAAPDSASAIHHVHFATYSSGAELTEARGGGTLRHPRDPRTTFEDNAFHMDGPGVFRMATELIAPFLERFLATLGWTQADFAAVVPHQASRHAVEQLARRLGFTPDQVVWNLAARGNTVAASIPLTLAEAVHGGRIQRGDRVLMIGTGAGLTLGAVALTY